MGDGWVKLHRKFLEWEWFSTANMVQVFLYLILAANHEDGRWQGVEVKRGQLITGRKTLSEKTGISEKAIRTCLNKLEITGEITKKTASKFSIITICKYNEYQHCEEHEGPAKGQQRASKGPAKGHKQECKNEKNKETHPSELRPEWFDISLWDAFLKNRKFKKLENSSLALGTICKKLKEAVDAGYSIDDCVQAYVSSKWQRFDVEWMKNVVTGKDGLPANKCQLCRYEADKVCHKTKEERKDCTAFDRRFDI